jgi:hypothetical protein
MVPLTLPAFATLASNDDSQLAAELQLVRLRAQAAVVRALTDEVEQLTRAEEAVGVGDRLVEELARLGCRLFEVASSLTRSPAPPEVSGVFECTPRARRGRRQAASRTDVADWTSS